MRLFSLRWPTVGLVLLTSFLLFGEGCSPVSVACLTDDECQEGSFCNLASKQCAQECNSSADCPQDQTCFVGRGKCIGGSSCDSTTMQITCKDGHVYEMDGCGFLGQKKSDCGLQGCNDAKCQQAPTGCGDGTCDPSTENCLNCPFDCSCNTGELCDVSTSSCQASANCGDGTCNPNDNENCVTCPFDCSCPSGERCDRNQQACAAFPSCGNGTCEPSDGENCGSCPFDCACELGKRCVNEACVISNPCGDGKCSPELNENCDTCPRDCGCPSGKSCKKGVCKDDSAARCGDGKCEGTESSASCCADCGCPSGHKCESGSCRLIDPPRCGNGRCEANETPQSCCGDCGCPGGSYCDGSKCCTCRPGQDRRCSGDQIQVCKSDCTGWQTEQSCGSGKTCKKSGSNFICESVCESNCSTEGQKRCNGGYAIQTCSRTPAGCVQWTDTQTCKSTEYCDAGTTSCKSSGCTDHKCPTVGAVRCDVRTVQECQNDASGCRVWKNTNYCTPPNTCSNGKCIYDCSSVNNCSLGPPHCSEGNVKQCELDDNNCRKLVTKQACTGGKTCYSPTTGVAYCQCDHKCPTVGDKRCNGNTVEECKTNSSNCRYWGGIDYCVPPYTCTGSKCVNNNCNHECNLGPVQCSGGNVVMCKTDSVGCRKLVVQQTCSGGKICKSPTTGVAYCECDHKCPTVGDKRCNGSAAEECKTNSSSCRYWAGTNYCTGNQVCSNGACIVPCNHECSLGPPHCSGGDVKQCETDANGCRKLVTKQDCSGRQSCYSPTTGVAYCQCTHECSSTGDKRCSGNTAQECKTDGNNCRYWAGINYCTGNQVCSNGACIVPCNHECSLGPVHCSGGDVKQCENDANGCRKLVTKQNCSGRQSCYSPTTGVAYCQCSHECSSTGSRRCSGNSVQECKTDGNNCRYWSTVQSCSSSQTCTNNSCVNNCTNQCSSGRRCNGNSVEECKTGSNGCKTWQGINYCTPPYTCSGGSCVVNCNNACSSGQKRCSGNTVQDCKTDSYGCRYWGNSQTCSSSQTCSNGTCVTTCNHACSYVGQKRCQGSTPSYAQECRTNSSGCRYWYTTSFCSPPQQCKTSTYTCGY
ncbi:MAG: hypothetical protein H6728_05620 [Myxococcales bacterium]|nr:hypothetical protein [Myxococcales bacterium]